MARITGKTIGAAMALGLALAAAMPPAHGAGTDGSKPAKAAAGDEELKMKVHRFGKTNLASTEILPDITYEMAWPESGLTPEALASLRQGVLDLFKGEAELPAKLRPKAPRAMFSALAAVTLRETSEYLAGGGNREMAEGVTDKRHLRVLRQTGGILVCKLETETYRAGMAHGISCTQYAAFELATGRRVMLADLFAPGAEPALTAAIKVALRVQRPKAIWEDEVKPVENFEIRPDGIRFHYNPYEVACYAEGQIDAMLDLATVRPLVKPGAAAAAIWRMAPVVPSAKGTKAAEEPLHPESRLKK